MAVDLRQVLSAFLTLTLFGMLSNMVRHDYFDSSEAAFRSVSSVQIGLITVDDQTPSDNRDGPWKAIGPELKSCWSKPAPLEEEPKGFITFSLTMGPGHHELEIANAVAVARFLGAKLVLPDIRGNEPAQTRRFGDVYDVSKFISGVEGVVHVAAELPAELAAELPPVVRIPDGASEAYMSSHVAPVFQKTGHIRIVVVLSESESTPSNDLDSVTCLTTHAALVLTSELRRAAAALVDQLRSPGQSVDGRFVAVDLRVDSTGSTVCSSADSEKGQNCFAPTEAAALLTKAGFDQATTVYLTQAKWHQGLEPIKEIFPRTFTKEDLIDSQTRRQVLGSGGEELGKAIDSYICTQGDVFLPASGDVIFAATVAGKRIAAGRTPTVPDISIHVARRCHC